MNKVFDEVEMKYRCTGRTTRLVDGYVQKLFENLKNSPDEYVTVIDHTGQMGGAYNIVHRIAKRIENEHKLVCQIAGNCIRINPTHREQVFRTLNNVQ